MKKYLNIIAIAVIALFTYSCEETVNGVELPYKELLVIRGELQADTSFRINITKTLPPLEEYSQAKAQIYEAKAFIECDNIIYPLKNSNSGYYTNPDLIPRAGKTYKLTVEWKNHIAYATTTIPINKDTLYNLKAEKKQYIDKWGWNIIEYTFFATAELGGNSATSITGSSIHQYNNIAFRYFNRFVNTFSGELNFGTFTTSNEEYFDIKYLEIKKYDIQYYDYYATMDEGEMEDDVFAVSGNNINWNIKGDGIGLFIGSNSKTINISK